ncbi:MAG TPA: FAD-dependent oxidoreductase [Candidatus Acidoferrales bacterium]|nr:FAD-dependent oxidoreductase [Candidatus Acidoferrales bacterium]
MSITTDVVVVGAGIVGAACAFELAKEGLRVSVVDGGFIGGGATGAGMGHIVVMDDSEAQFALTRYSQMLWDDLEEAAPSNVEFDRCGTIWVAADDEEMAEVRRKFSYYGERGVQTEILDAQALRQAEPNLRRPLAGGLLVRGDSVLYPPCAAAFLLEKARGFGARLHLEHRIARIGKGSVFLDDARSFSANYVVNATGHDAPRLTPGINIKPRKGHLVITDRYPGLIKHQLVELGYLKSAHVVTSDSVAFNVQPRKTGQILIGSSRQYDIASGEVDSKILARMLQRAFEYVPRLASASSIRTWTGFRAATPDKLPLIGPWRDDPSIILAAGHEGLGITTSLATGRLVADRILGRKPAIPVEPYLPSRQMSGAHA